MKIASRMGMGLALLVFAMAGGSAEAQIDPNSANWEGSYEANVHPNTVGGGGRTPWATLQTPP